MCPLPCFGRIGVTSMPIGQQAGHSVQESSYAVPIKSVAISPQNQFCCYSFSLTLASFLVSESASNRPDIPSPEAT